MSKIEWTDKTWNPVTGCTRVSKGCDHCYAVTQTVRNVACGQTAKYGGLVDPGKRHFNGVVREHPDALELPLRWKKPKRVFVNSMSDLFHPGVSDQFIGQVFDVMRRATWHQFQVLTKRPERAAKLSSSLPWPVNVWLGVSVEGWAVVDRVDHLRRTGARVKFLSCEPLLGSLSGIDLSGIDWVIAGGESGPRARPMVPRHARGVRDHCLAAGVPFFFKQWGAHNEDGVRVGKKVAGRLLDGRVHDACPKPLSPFPSLALRGL